MNKNLKKNLIVSLQSMLICLFLFFVLKVPMQIYAALIIFSIFILAIQIYKNIDGNIKVVQRFLSVFLGSGISFSYLNYIVDSINYYLYFLGVNIAILGLHYLCCISYQDKEENTERIKSDGAFKNRRNDLEKIKSLIKDNDIHSVGIEAAWGDGKTFLVEKIKEDFLKDQKYEFITIDVLACNLDSLPQTLVEGIEQVLYDNQILSEYSKCIKRFFNKNKNIEIFGELLSETNESYTNAFDNLKRELDKIEKTVVIIYEDIDRILDRKLIKKIFYISEKLTFNQKHIKVIYQYNPVHLKAILGNDAIKAGFVEKYIPYTMRLSSVSFIEVIEHLLAEKEIPEDRLKNEDFFLLDKDRMLFFNFIPESLKYNDPIIKKVNEVLLSAQSIRKIEHFLTELNEILEREKYLLEYKNIIRDVIFIKHFFPQVYAQFKAWKIFGDYFKVTFDEDEKQTTLDMYEVIQQNLIKELNEDDFEKYIAYSILMNNNKNRKEIDEFYEKTTRIIRHLMEPWQETMTDYQWIVEKITPVLESNSNEEAQMKYKEVFNECYSKISHLFEGNIVLFLNSPWALYFKAFKRQFVNDENKYFEKLLGLYFKLEKPTNINDKFFENLQPIFEYLQKEQLNNFLKEMIALDTDFQYDGERCDDFFECIVAAMGKLFYFDNKTVMMETDGFKQFYSQSTFVTIKNRLSEYTLVLEAYGKIIGFDKEVINNILLFCDFVINSKSAMETKPIRPIEKEQRPLSDDEFLSEMEEADIDEQNKLVVRYVESQRNIPYHYLEILKRVVDSKKK